MVAASTPGAEAAAPTAMVLPTRDGYRKKHRKMSHAEKPSRSCLPKGNSNVLRAKWSCRSISTRQASEWGCKWRSLQPGCMEFFFNGWASQNQASPINSQFAVPCVVIITFNAQISHIVSRLDAGIKYLK